MRRRPETGTPRRLLIPLLALVLALTGAVPLSGCNGSDETTRPPDPFELRKLPAGMDEPVAQVVAGNTGFAVRLYKELAASREGNLILSPHSISTALAMTWAGARTTTEAEMATTLGFPFGQETLHPVFGALQASLETGAGIGGYQLHIANRLWGQEGETWLDAFLEVNREHYGAPLEPLDLHGNPEGSRTRINGWVGEKTQGRIPDLIPAGAISSQTVLVLTNAIWFKGLWASRFDAAHTADAPFRTGSGATTTVKMMTQTAELPFLETASVQVLELPYDGGDLGMVFVLPVDPNRLDEIEADLTEETLTGWLGALSPAEVEVHLPRFRFDSAFELNDPLIHLGMPSAFGHADFSGMNGVGGLFISLVVHKGFIEVNEEGSEAAGATGVLIDRTSLGSIFRADHPFLFAIRDHVTGAILFLGRVVEP